MAAQKAALLAVLAVLLSLLVAPAPARAGDVTRYEGTFEDGATYLIEVPADWNGTFVLYSHGYTAGPSNPARDVGDPLTGAWLLDHGYALGGSSYATTGWALEQAFPDQVAVIDLFTKQVGTPQRTIAWGHSLGGMITAGLVQLHPELFAGSLPMCGVLAGGVGVWNQSLDGEFVFKTLLAPDSDLQLVNITNPAANLGLANSVIDAAQGTAEGRARLALAAAVGDLPGWFDPLSPEPGRHDYAAREQNQYLWDRNVDFAFAFALRAELEQRAGGNPSWNTGVNYREQLQNSVDEQEVRALYQQAGLDLNADLNRLAHTQRIAADEGAVQYLEQNIIYDGHLAGLPVLTLHTTGDGLVQVQNENAYADVVESVHQGNLLQQVFTHRAGHCTFTPAETITAFQSLVQRLDTGRWGNLSPNRMNQAAQALGDQYNVLSGQARGPEYLRFDDRTDFLREFDARNLR